MEKSQRHLIVGYAVFTLFFLACLFVYILFRIDILSLENKNFVESSLGQLIYNTKTRFGLDGSFSGEEMSTLFRDTLNQEPRLLVIVVESKDHGILKAVGKSKEYLVNAQFGDYTRDLAYNKPTGTTEINLPLALHYNNQDLTVRLSALYISFSSRDSVSLIWEILYILLGFFGMTLVMIVITSILARRQYKPAGEIAGARDDDFLKEEPSPYAMRDRTGDPESGEPEIESLDPYMEEEPVVSEKRAQPPGPGPLYSEITGLTRRDFFMERFENEIERSVSFDQEISLMLLSVQPGGAGGIHPLKEVAPVLHRHFPLQDLAFEYAHDCAAVVIPDEDIDAALKTAKVLYQDLAERNIRVTIGISARNGRMLRAGPLITEAKGALHHALKSASGPIVAFRADPKKFRDNLFL